MLSEPRTISLLCEIIHVPLKHDADRLRELYGLVCKSCGYENFIRTPAGARIERQDPERRGFSHVTLSSDRLQFTEDHAGISIEQFSEKVSAVLRDAVRTLSIPLVLAQQVTVRVITSPHSFRTSAEFLARRLFRIEPEDLGIFERPTSVFGFRLAFPSTKPDEPQFAVRVESYVRDPRSLYIENVGTFKTPIVVQSLEAVEKNVQRTSAFVSDKVVPFLTTYDGRES